MKALDQFLAADEALRAQLSTDERQLLLELPPKVALEAHEW